MAHRHRVKTEETYLYAHPVAWPENPSAHGNVTLHQTCSCGALRKINVNGRHREMGDWKAVARETFDDQYACRHCGGPLYLCAARRDDIEARCRECGAGFDIPVGEIKFEKRYVKEEES